MKRVGNGLTSILRHVDESEARVRQQQHLIAQLEVGGQPTAQAEKALATFKATVQQLHNHLDIMRELMTPSR